MMRKEGIRRLSILIGMLTAVLSTLSTIGSLLNSESFIPDDRVLPEEIAESIRTWKAKQKEKQPGTWFDYAEKVGLLRDDVPDDVYNSERHAYFDAYVAPKARQGGYNVGATREDFINKTERPGGAAPQRPSRIVAGIGLGILIGSAFGLLSGSVAFISLRLVSWVIDGFRRKENDPQRPP